MQVESLAEQLFFSTIPINTVFEDGARGSGTGFVYIHGEPPLSYPFLVTAKHVVDGNCDGVREGTFTFKLQENDLPAQAGAVSVSIPEELWQRMWFPHPDPTVDVAVFPLGPLIRERQAEGHRFFFRSVFPHMVPARQALEELDAIEVVTFMGYPDGIWDDVNILPIARRGTTATPISVDFKGRPEFLIDGSVFGGSSGSPVFIFNQGMWSLKSGGSVAGTRLMFIGLITESMYRVEPSEVDGAPASGQRVPIVRHHQMVDLGVVTKARAVTEVVAAWLAAYAPST